MSSTRQENKSDVYVNIVYAVAIQHLQAQCVKLFTLITFWTDDDCGIEVHLGYVFTLASGAHPELHFLSCTPILTFSSRDCNCILHALLLAVRRHQMSSRGQCWKCLYFTLQAAVQGHLAELHTYLPSGALSCPFLHSIYKVPPWSWTKWHRACMENSSTTNTLVLHKAIVWAVLCWRLQFRWMLRLKKWWMVTPSIRCAAAPLGGECLDHSFCSEQLQHSQHMLFLSLPAPWLQPRACLQTKLPVSHWKSASWDGVNESA